MFKQLLCPTLRNGAATGGPLEVGRPASALSVFQRTAYRGLLAVLLLFAVICDLNLFVVVVVVVVVVVCCFVSVVVLLARRAPEGSGLPLAAGRQAHSSRKARPLLAATPAPR
ncbi:unnamed protein product [Polarella glacialis]|uniref:Uncharacterized protein n=1 Tax=Polarella glacialis TaxID=89957 RepID=A0A813LTD2_POLGL|nr:unnamed protein product [Polarella glacialis]